MGKCSVGHENCCYESMIRDGDCYLFYAPKGDGKTTAALILGWKGKNHNYQNVSNILLERWHNDERRWRKVLKSANYIYIDDFEKFAWELLRFLRERKDPAKPQHMLFVLDEVTLSLIRSGQTVLSPFVQAAIGLTAVSRHLHFATMLLTQSQDLVSARFRGIEGGLVTGYIKKPSMPGYGAKEVLEWSLPDPDLPTITIRGKLRVNLKKVPRKVGTLVGWARTREMIQKSDGNYENVPIFNTDAVAKFTMGVFTRGRRAGQPFDLQSMLQCISGEEPEDIPGLIEAYLLGEIGQPTKPSKQPELFEPEEEGESEEETEEGEDIVPAPAMPMARRGEKSDQARRMLRDSGGQMSDRAIGKQLDMHHSSVHDERVKLEGTGQIPVVRPRGGKK